MVIEKSIKYLWFVKNGQLASYQALIKSNGSHLLICDESNNAYINWHCKWSFDLLCVVCTYVLRLASEKQICIHEIRRSPSYLCPQCKSIINRPTDREKKSFHIETRELWYLNHLLSFADLASTPARVGGTTWCVNRSSWTLHIDIVDSNAKE